MSSIKIVRNGVEAEVVEQYLGSFLSDGWDRVVEPQSDGQLDDIESKISASASKDDIELIIKDALGVDLDKRGGIDTVKEKALSLIRDSKPE